MIEYGINEALKSIKENAGGPFGAVITDKSGNILSIASNTVLASHDATAHAEINAIRLASKKLGTYNLEGCKLYTTCYPCPMCMGAIIWSNIKEIYYGCTREDASNLGFRDDYIYDYIKSGCNNDEILKIKQIDRDKCIRLFEEYKKDNKEIY